MIKKGGIRLFQRRWLLASLVVYIFFSVCYNDHCIMYAWNINPLLIIL
jgi:hypothetical protein